MPAPRASAAIALLDAEAPRYSDVMLPPDSFTACLFTTLLLLIPRGAGLGILLHTLAAALGLTLAIEASPTGFWAIKLAGATFGK